jgi:YHS domain-containing protein
MINWQIISGSDPASPCILCGEPTPNHFWSSYKEGRKEFVRAYYFCDDICVEKFRHILAQLGVS